PELQAYILDLAAVVPLAQRHIEQAGLAARVHTRIGDLRSDHLGEGYDLVFASAICHMLDEKENARLIARCYDAVAPGGRLAIQEFILEPDKCGPQSAALFSLNMLVGTRAGASYSEPEYTAWMQAAGFTAIRRVRMPGPAGLMIGTRAV
ncbi:MAG: methyltransferase, partial [Bryobacteraceae bacterium]